MDKAFKSSKFPTFYVSIFNVFCLLSRLPEHLDNYYFAEVRQTDTNIVVILLCYFTFILPPLILKTPAASGTIWLDTEYILTY